MKAVSFFLFETSIGTCGIAWGPCGIVAIRLPDSSPSHTRAWLLKKYPNVVEAQPAPDGRQAIDAICGLLAGEPGDLSRIPLDMNDVPAFHRRVYEAARTIPPGATLTYGDVAKRIGAAGAARAVGQALGRNPFAVVVPCHRVIAASGKLHGFSAHGGIETKRRLLEIEKGSGIRD